jgi:hypothetical protein
MGLKLAMPQSASPKSEMSALAQTHARLKAWWNGDPAPDFKVVPTQSEANAQSAKAYPGDSDPNVAHTIGCAAIWGAGRTYPSHTDLETMLFDQMLGEKASRIALFDGGVGASAQLFAELSAAKIDAFDDNAQRRKLFEDALKSHKQAKRFAVHAFDWQPGSLPKNKVDAALFMFAGADTGRLEVAAFGAERILRPGGRVIWFDFFAREDDASLDPYRGFEQRAFQREDEAIIAFSAAGLDVTADDDWTARYLTACETAWNDLQEHLSLRQAKLIKTGGMSAGTAAIADLMTWKARMQALRSGQLYIRRILATK